MQGFLEEKQFLPHESSFSADPNVQINFDFINSLEVKQNNANSIEKEDLNCVPQIHHSLDDDQMKDNGNSDSSSDGSADTSALHLLADFAMTHNVPLRYQCSIWVNKNLHFVAPSNANLIPRARRILHLFFKYSSQISIENSGPIDPVIWDIVNADFVQWAINHDSGDGNVIKAVRLILRQIGSNSAAPESIKNLALEILDFIRMFHRRPVSE
jgi:hypothetical protein